MYDYQNDNKQLSEENEVGTFPNGGGISSDFKLHKESLPQWAVDWARSTTVDPLKKAVRF